MTDIERTIAALRENAALIEWWSAALHQADYISASAMLAFCDAAERGMQCPPREPTQEMISCGVIVMSVTGGTLYDDVCAMWRAMWDAAPKINEGGQDVDKSVHADGSSPSVPVPPSPDDLVARLHDCYEGCPAKVTTAPASLLREAADAVERLTRQCDDHAAYCAGLERERDGAVRNLAAIKRMATARTAQSWLLLSDHDKLITFAIACDESERRKLAERERDEWRHQAESNAGCHNESEAECERLRADAERYRWLREGSVLAMPFTRYYWSDELDATIDAARKA